MSNHIHIILAGPYEDVIAFFELFKSRLGFYLARRGRCCRMDRFVAETFQIPDLRTLRSEIIYVHRNGYLVHPDCTPFSYWWSAGVYFFNPVTKMLPSRAFSDFSVHKQRAICHCRTVSLPPGYRVLENFSPDGSTPPEPLLLPSSFCAISEAESYFADSHQYFRKLTKDHEANGEIARRLGDRIFLTDDELFGAVCSICAREFGLPQPGLLSGTQKVVIARRMRFDYNASSKQIQRILKLSPAIVSTLFPCPSSTNKADSVDKWG